MLTSEEILQRDKEQSDFYQGVMEKFNGHCVVCYPMRPSFGSVTVHELESKAQNPKGWWKSLDNGIPLCQKHHDLAHQKSTSESREWLRIHAEKVLNSLGRM